MPYRPKVSIVVPIYGVEKYLHQCIDSILAQTLKEIEIILVDDGSPDNCPQIVDEYAKRDSRVIAVHQSNGGYGRAVNHGMELATAPYIGIVEPDDWIESTMYEKLYSSVIKNNSDVSKSNFFMHIDIEGIGIRNRICEWYTEKSLWEKPSSSFTVQEHPEFFYFHPSVWSCLYRRDFLKNHDILMEEIPGSGWTDNLFQVQTLCLAQSISYVDEPLYYWRVRTEDEAEALKDIEIPLLRTRSIHKWLRGQGITDETIWACLHKREIVYLHFILRAAGYNKQQKKMRSILSEMCQKINKKVLNENKYITKNDRDLFCFIEEGRYNKISIRKILYYIKTFRRCILSIRIPSKIFGESKFRIIILGCQFARRRDMAYDIPCLFRVELMNRKCF